MVHLGIFVASDTGQKRTDATRLTRRSLSFWIVGMMGDAAQ
jgi:hypothetical protein